MDVLHQCRAGTPGMCRDAATARLEQRGDPQELTQAAAERRVGLGDVEGVLLGEDPPLGNAGQGLAAGDPDARRAAQLAVAPRVGVRQRLLEQEQVERLDGLDHGQGRRHLPARDRQVVLVAIEQDRDVGSDVLTDEGELLGLEIGGRSRLGEGVLIAVGGRGSGADLERPEPEAEVEVDLVGQARLRVDGPAACRVAEQAVMAPPAEQLVDRLAQLSTAQVPEGRLDPGQHGEAEPGPCPVAPGVEEAGGQGRHVLDGLVEQDRPVEVDDRRDRFGDEVAGVRLAQAGQFGVGQDLDEGRAAAGSAEVRVVRAWPGQQDRPNVHDAHAGSSPRASRGLHWESSEGKVLCWKCKRRRHHDDRRDAQRQSGRHRDRRGRRARQCDVRALRA